LRNGFDYINLKVGKSSGISNSFGGVSGGGLWKVLIYMNSLGKPDWIPLLVGVAFWEETIGSGMLIRCHGPKTIKATMLKAWRKVYKAPK
jgi:hypothetical protein